MVTTWAPLEAQNYTSDWLWPSRDELLGEPLKFCSLGPQLLDSVPLTKYTFFGSVGMI